MQNSITMRIAMLLFLLVSLRCSAQAETIFTVSKQVNDSSKVDTTGQASISRMMELPEGYSLISCDVIFSNHHEVFKVFYKRGSRGVLSQIQSFMGRAKPKDLVSFENVVVLKDGKTMRLADKTITIF